MAAGMPPQAPTRNNPSQHIPERIGAAARVGLRPRSRKPAAIALEAKAATAEEERRSSRRTQVRGLHVAPAVSRAQRSCLLRVCNQ